MAVHELAGKPAPRELLENIPRRGERLLRHQSGPGKSPPKGVLRHLGPPGELQVGQLQRGSCAGHQPGHLRIQKGRGHRRPPVHGHGHPRLERTGAHKRPGGAGRKRRAGAHPGRTGIHPHPGHLPRHPHPQPVRPGAESRRYRDNPFPQSPGRRRFQIQPAPRRAGGRGNHFAHPGQGQPAFGRGQRRGKAHAV